jgi:hypothetical protein
MRPAKKANLDQCGLHVEMTVGAIVPVELAYTVVPVYCGRT